MRGIGAENTVANGPASRTRSKSKNAAPGTGRALAAEPAAARSRPSGKPPPPQAQQQQQPQSRKLAAVTLLSLPATAHQGSKAAGAEPERRLQEEACVG